MTNNKPVIIKKVKKGGHGGHHGGAWKVAYADFVTAMMAFFLLLWLLNATTEEQKRGIANYFDPVTVSRSANSGSGGMLGGASLVSPSGSMASQASQMHAVTVDGLRPTSEGNDQQKIDAEPVKKEEEAKSGNQTKTEKVEVDQKLEAGKGQEKKIESTEKSIEKAHEQIELERFKKAEAELRAAIQGSPDLKDLADNLLIDQTPDGMRIQIVDKSKKEMFPLGSADMFDYTKQLLLEVGHVIAKVPNQIEITGHTDSRPYKGGKGSNWELSAKRADSSRKALADSGLDANRIEEVTGKADREHLVPEDPESPMNRRISIILLKDSVVQLHKNHQKTNNAPAESSSAAIPAAIPAMPAEEKQASPVAEMSKPADEKPADQKAQTDQQADATPVPAKKDAAPTAPEVESVSKSAEKKRAADTGPI